MLGTLVAKPNGRAVLDLVRLHQGQKLLLVHEGFDCVLEPGASGQGLSFSLAPTWGTPSSGAERLWSARDARGLAPNSEFEPESRLTGELGYRLPAFGGAFTGTPNVGFEVSDSAREVRPGWRLTPAGVDDSGFEVSVDATRTEAAGGEAPEHGVMLRGAVRW